MPLVRSAGACYLTAMPAIFAGTSQGQKWSSTRLDYLWVLGVGCPRRDCAKLKRGLFQGFQPQSLNAEVDTGREVMHGTTPPRYWVFVPELSPT